MDLLILITTACLGALLGLLIGSVVPDKSVEATAGWMVLWTFAGSLSGLLIVALLQQKNLAARKRRRSVAPRLRPATPSTPFRDRLAKYADKDASDVMSPSQAPSRMPFWASQTWYGFFPPKSAASIRRLLLSIRRIVRG